MLLPYAFILAVTLFITNNLTPSFSFKHLQRPDTLKPIRQVVRNKNPILNRIDLIAVNSASLNESIIEKNESGIKSKLKFIIPSAIAVLAGAYAFKSGLVNIDIPQLLEATIAKIESLGPYGYLYFSLVCIFIDIIWQG